MDPPGSNRKVAKKSRIQFPVLSDEGGEWMLAYRVTKGGLRENMAFLIEPDLGRVSEHCFRLPFGSMFRFFFLPSICSCCFSVGGFAVELVSLPPAIGMLSHMRS